MGHQIVKIYKDPARDGLAKTFAEMSEAYGAEAVVSERKRTRELLRPSITALAVMDMQVGFCDEKYLFPRGAVRPGESTKEIGLMVPKLASFIDEARRYGVRLVWLRNDEEFGPGDPQYDYYGVRPRSGEREIVERDAFENPELDAFLMRNGVTTLLCAGVYAHACVSELAKHAPLHGQDPVIVTDLTADLIVAWQGRGLYGAHLIAYPMPSENIIRTWARIEAERQREMDSVTLGRQGNGEGLLYSKFLHLP